uniref:Exostosin GT47 domain-containing protein n=1 Tax=Haptolina ericina TaxID=156174 RepID=A0A7S3AY15_9EUKA
MLMGQHRFVLSPRGNGLDAHRTWEALLVGAIPIVRSSKLNPLYDNLPILIVKDWNDVTPRLLRDFYKEVQSKLSLYHYERLFADYWIGQMAVQRERCLAEIRASTAPEYVYRYNSPGGWVAVKDGKPLPAPTLDVDAPAGGGGRRHGRGMMGR